MDFTANKNQTIANRIGTIILGTPVPIIPSLPGEVCMQYKL